jgi:phage terminase large subunit-like protein
MSDHCSETVRLEWACTSHDEVVSPLATEGQAQLIDAHWSGWAEPAQLPPPGDWRVWLFMGGRGSGKTRAGAEWVRGLVENGAAKRIALVGPTLSDVREVMIEGPSGLRSVGLEANRPTYEVSRRRLVWPNGAEGFAFSAEDPESLRGPQFDAAWCDEIGAWPRDKDTWDTLMFCLRLGRDPRIVATTTPRAPAGEAAGETARRRPRRHRADAGGDTRERRQSRARFRRYDGGRLCRRPPRPAGTGWPAGRRPARRAVYAGRD